MPSRAVLRKKARRESKRQKKLQNNEVNKVCTANSHDDSEFEVTKSVAVTKTKTTTSSKSEYHVANASVPSAPIANTVASVSKIDERCEPTQRKRKRENVDIEDSTDNTVELPHRKLTHRERVKRAAQAKLEKEIMRLNAISARAEERKRHTTVDATSDSNANTNAQKVNMTSVDTQVHTTHHLTSTEIDANHVMELASTAQESTSHLKNDTAPENSDACISVQEHSSHYEHDGKEENTNLDQISHLTSLESKPRHDPRFVNGTFWRNRKEKRARTLFLGGMPSTYSLQEIEELIDRVVRKDSNAAPYLKELAENDKAVEHVDLLPLKHGSKVRHMFVVMASVALAGCASLRLDGMRINQHALRCNFAADKTQRAEAIRRRAGPQRQEPRR